MPHDGRRDQRRILLQALAKLYGTSCCRCGRHVDPDAPSVWPWGPSVDHVEALATGGSDELENVRLAHLRCNAEHGNGVLRNGTTARRGRGDRRPSPGQLDLGFDVPRRRFLVAVPAALAAARLGLRTPARPPLAPPIRYWIDTSSVPLIGVNAAAVRLRQGDASAVIAVPYALLEDPHANVWAWVRPRIAEAIAYARAA